MFIQEYKFISSQNKFIYALLVLNALFILVILYLLLRSDKPAGIVNKNPEAPRQTIEKTVANTVANNTIPTTTMIQEELVSAEPEITTEPIAEISENSRQIETSDINKELADIIQTVSAEETQTIEKSKTVEPDASNKIEIYYDGQLVRTEETDPEGNQIITISKSLDDIGELSNYDANYVKALEELKRGTRSHITINKPTAQVATTYKAKQNNDGNQVDYFNKVDVSNNNSVSLQEKQSLAKQIATIVSEPEETISIDVITPEEPTDSYIEKLKTESIERANEMRIIQVVQGDTLWDIAARAYGSGDNYNKIYQANPHLTSPDKIEVGDYLRVPL